MKSNKKWSMLTLIMMFWFTISFITNILGPLIPDIIHNFELKDLAMAGFIPTSFFLAYAIMSIPAGIFIELIGEYDRSGRTFMEYLEIPDFEIRLKAESTSWNY